MLKVMTIVGTRPKIICFSRTIAKLDTFYDHTLMHTGQNCDYVQSLFWPKEAFGRRSVSSIARAVCNIENLNLI